MQIPILRRRNSMLRDLDNIKEENMCNCSPKILLVDDNLFNLMPLKMMIKRLKIDFDIVEDYKKLQKSDFL